MLEKRPKIEIVDALEGLELIEAVHPHPRFTRHAHPTYALGVVYWGANRFRYRGAFHTAPTGAVCTVTPDEPHAVEPANGRGFAYRCLYPTASLLQRVAEPVHGRRLSETLLLPPTLEDPELARLIHLLFNSDRAPALAREAGLYAVLTRLVAQHARPAPPTLPRQPALPTTAAFRARDYLAAHCEENVTLSRLAARVDVEPFALLRAFTRAHGLPPHAWLIQERVRRAQSLLRDGVAPAEAASASGFTDQSHLNRHFKRVVGVTPGDYRRAAMRRRRRG